MHPTEEWQLCMEVTNYHDCFLLHKIWGGVISLIRWVSLIYISELLTLPLLWYSTEVEQASFTAVLHSTLGHIKK
jgi:hypothetical protein